MRLGVVALVLAFAPLARAETRPHYGGTVEATLLGAPGSLDPVAVRSHAEATVISLAFDTLYTVGADGIAQPHLAVDPPVLDEKKLVARIAIRPDVKFHDGTALTAQDVAASLERARTAAKWAFAPVISLRADGDAVELQLRAPVPELETLLALPQAAVTKGGKPAGERPIGSGPFVIEAIDRAHHRLVLRAFDDHFAGRPYVDQLILRWYDTPDGEARKFETGAAHVSARGATAFAGAQPAFKADDVEGPTAVLVYVGFGRNQPQVTGAPAFRRALDLALARSALATIGSGERVVPTHSPVPAEAGGVPLDAAARAGDPDAARAQLDAAHLHPTRLEILVEDTRPDDREIAERVVRALDKLGVPAAIVAVTAGALRDRIAKGNCDLYVGQLVAPVTSQLAWWGTAFAAGGDDWPVPALEAGGLDLAAAAKAFDNRLPIVPLMFRSVRLWHRTDVRGVAFDGFGRPTFADLSLFGNPVRGRP